MSLKQKATEVSVREAIKYVKKDYDTNLFKLISWGKKMVKDELHLKVLTRLEERLSDSTNVYADYVKRVIMSTDTNIIVKLVQPFVNAVIKSYDIRKKAMEEHDCNIPWAVLIDITTACNLKCKGCWAAEYGNKLNMSYDDLNKVIQEGKALGTYVYLYTGGEPLVRKNDILRICKENPDCLFHAFTNGTLCDDEFVENVKEVGNLLVTISIEGNEETTEIAESEETTEVEETAETEDTTEVEEIAGGQEESGEPVEAGAEGVQTVGSTQDVSRPTIAFLAREITLKKGEQPNWESVMGEIKDDKDSREALLGTLEVRGGYTLEQPGSYYVTLLVKDSDGNESNAYPMKLIVEE